MRAFLIILTALALLAPHTARANDNPWFKIGPEDTTALLAKPENLPKTPVDFANIFYGNCVASNTAKSMKDYVAGQCACTASKMPSVLDEQQTRFLFNLVPGKKSDFAYTRFMMMAYLPCMENTVHDMVLDSCISDRSMRQMKYHKAVCQCVADGAQKYVSKYGEYMLPGLTFKGFDPKQAEANPLASALKFTGFQMDSQYMLDTCTQRLSLGWSE